MATVSSYDAKTHFSALLERARQGETVVITRYGAPIARLVPMEEKRPIDETLDALLDLRRHATVGRLSTKDLIEEGRRF